MKRVALVFGVIAAVFVIVVTVAAVSYREFNRREAVQILQEETGVDLPKWDSLKVDHSFEFCVSGRMVFNDYPVELEQQLKARPVQQVAEVAWLAKYGFDRGQFGDVGFQRELLIATGEGKRWGWEIAMSPKKKTLWFIWGFPRTRGLESTSGSR